MASRSVEVKKFTIPVTAIAALTDDQRHFYYLSGLIYNEIGCLRKLIGYSIGAHGDRRPFRREAEFSQTFLLLRITAAKVYEAQTKLNAREVQAVLRADVFPQWSDGVQTLKKWNRMVSSATWLARLRNTIGFHYPSLPEWKAVITPTDSWQDDVIYFGDEPGNMYFDAPEQQVREFMFGRGRGSTPDDKVFDVIKSMVAMTTELGDFVERAQVHFAMARLLGTQSPTVVGRVIAPPSDEVEFPFWTQRASGNKRKRS